jgi:YbbR domain-containing protein
MNKSLLSNIPLKILSLGIAITLWILIRGEQRTDIYLDIKVDLKNLPQNLVITNQNSDRINLRLTGPKAIISRIDEKYFKPYICDLADANPGEFACRIAPSNFKMDKGVQIVHVTPREIKVDLETFDKKEVGIEPGFAGKLDSGYEIDGYDIYPDKVTVTGPKSQVNDLSILKTVPIDLSGRKKSFVDKFPILLPGRNLAIEGSSEFVLVNVQIREEQVTRIIKDVPLKLFPESSGFRIEPKFINVKVTGQSVKVDEVKKEQIVALVEAPNVEISKTITLDKIECHVELAEIPGVTLVSVTPVYYTRKSER